MKKIWKYLGIINGFYYLAVTSYLQTAVERAFYIFRKSQFLKYCSDVHINDIFRWFYSFKSTLENYQSKINWKFIVIPMINFFLFCFLSLGIFARNLISTHFNMKQKHYKINNLIISTWNKYKMMLLSFKILHQFFKSNSKKLKIFFFHCQIFLSQHFIIPTDNSDN